MKQIKKELVEKYEKMSFLEGIPNEDKEELSQLYEDFTNFLIAIKLEEEFHQQKNAHVKRQKNL